MSQSLSQIYIHLIFGTKYRDHLIKEDIAPDLHAYMASILKKSGCSAIIINSVPDHVHLLFRLSKKIALTTVIEQVKKGSSKWMKIQPVVSNQFYWQRGYGAFSVSGSKVYVVSKYIANQREHHKHLSYKEEVELFMKRYKVEQYNPKYFWEE